VDYRIDHAINLVARHHPLLASILAGFATWGVIVFGAAAVLLWFLAPPGRSAVWKRAGTAGLAAAALALAVNQVIIHIWQRPRPYQAHPHTIIPLLARSTDPSFPSDHASAAFGIAIGILLVHRRAGYLFLAGAILIALSRVATGMHYPTDVLAGAAIGIVSGYLAARVAMEPLLSPLIRTASTVTDPVVRTIRRQPLTCHTVLQPRVRVAAVALVGTVLLLRFAWDMRRHLVDELPLTALLLWILLTIGAAWLAARRVDDGAGLRQP
jgi:membrane-associated phospholipid phosphatase